MLTCHKYDGLPPPCNTRAKNRKENKGAFELSMRYKFLLVN